MASGWRSLTTAVVAGLIGLGCSKPVTAPVSAQFQVSADARINPDSMGNSLSVGIRLFELKDLTEFSKLTLEAANSEKTPSELIGPALVSFSEFTAVPGATAPRTVVLQPDTKAEVGELEEAEKPCERHPDSELLLAEVPKRERDTDETSADGNELLENSGSGRYRNTAMAEAAAVGDMVSGRRRLQHADHFRVGCQNGSDHFIELPQSGYSHLRVSVVVGCRDSKHLPPQ